MSPRPKQPSRTPAEAIERCILVVRDRQVMLDVDLAELYGVETKRLVQQVTRNSERFPDDFMFQLSKEEARHLRSQFATSSDNNHGGRRHAPYVFTEQGVAMLSSVLRSGRAVDVNIEIMRAFVKMRAAAASHKELASRLDELERTVGEKLGEHDKHLAAIFRALKQLAEPPKKRKRSVGFAPPES